MQIVSHMDSRDKHRVRGWRVLWGGLRVGLAPHPTQVGRGLLRVRPHNSMDVGLASWPLLLGAGGWPCGVVHAGRGPSGPRVLGSQLGCQLSPEGPGVRAHRGHPPSFPHLPSFSQSPPPAPAPASWFWG